MILDGLTLNEGSEAQNLTVASGLSFPLSPNIGELFYNTTVLTKGLYTFDGSIWDKVVFTSINLDTLLVSVGTPGTYRSVTTDSKGRVTAGSNPTTLAGYGITDAQPLDADLTAIALLAGTSGFLKKTAVNTWTLDTATYLTGNQTITISGDISGSGTTTITLTLPSTGVSAGTYKSVTVNSKGLVTAGSNPTTLAGYGITDAQPLDADLTSVSNLLTTGIVVRSAADTFVTRTLNVSGIGLSISNANGTTGDILISSNASSTNIPSTLVTRDSSGNFTANQITASLFGNANSANSFSVGRTISVSSDASGSSGIFDGSANVTIPLILTSVNANVGNFGSASQIPTITVDAKGRTTSISNTVIAIPTSAIVSGVFDDARISTSNVTQHQASLTLTESQITDGALLARNASNETISGAWSFSNPIVGVTPVVGSHLTTKDYVDNIATGLDMKASCRVATTTNIALSGTPTVDGINLVAGNRILVKDQSTSSQNGIYVVAPGAWARSADADNSPSSEVTAGMYTFISEGTENADSGWVLITDDTIVLGTTPLSFTQFTGLGQISAGAGLSKTGSVIDIGSASSSRIVINADNIDLATAGTAGTYRSVTTDVYGRVTAGTNPTTLTGYGITDAQSLDADLTAIAALAGTSGFLKKTAVDTWILDTNSYALLSSAVTSVSVVSANGVSGSVTATTTPAITISLGAITPSSVVSTGIISGTTITATTQFTGPATGLTGTAVSLTAGSATSLVGGGTISTTAGTFTGTLTVKTPPLAALITGATSGSIEVPNVSGISSPTHATFLHQTTTLNTGYVQHVSLGSYRSGVSQWDSFYIGIGGNDAYPTNKFSFGYDGSLTHSITGTFLTSANFNGWAPTFGGAGASGTWNINITGNAATVTTNANLTGVVTSVGNATSIANGAITNAMLVNTAVTNLSGTNTGDNAVNSSSTPISHVGTGGASHAVATTSVAGFMSDTDKTKLDSITAGANNYVHPVNHPPSIITQDTSNRFVTDAEKATWNAKQNALGAGSVSNAMLANTAVANLSGTNTGDETLATIKSKLGITTLSGANTGDNSVNSSSTPISHVGSSGASHAVATTSVAGFMSETDKTKLDGITTGANNYVHPVNHPPSIITQDTSNRFVTDAEKATWNAKQEALGAGSVSNTMLANGAVANLSGTNTGDETLSSINSKLGITTLSGSNTGDNSVNSSSAPIAHVGSGGSEHALVISAGAAGFMSGADKSKLDGIAAGATNYVHTTNANLTGPVTSIGNATSISANVITNAMLSDVSTSTFKGRITAGSGSLEDLSTSQATSLLDTFTSGLKGLTPASGGGTTNFLRADGSWVAVSAGGTTLSDDTTTNASTFYPTMASNQTSGSLSAVVVSSSKLSYNPSIGTLNATNFNTTSDERAKENIRSLGYGLDEVLQMTGKKFEMKDSGQTSIGLIAQEVLKVIPEVVSDNGSDRLGVNYPVLTAVLIEAIKELTTRVAELEQKCKTL